MPFWRIDALQGLDHEGDAFTTAIEDARASREETEVPLLPSLDFTEGNPAWTMLYNHIRIGQIRPERIRRMRRVDLEFIAASVSPSRQHDVGDTATWKAIHSSEAKLQGNIGRARGELHRRDTVVTSVLIGGLGALLGGALLALTQ